jgi:hypothetical protein
LSKALECGGKRSATPLWIDLKLLTAVKLSGGVVTGQLLWFKPHALSTTPTADNKQLTIDHSR